MFRLHMKSSLYLVIIIFSNIYYLKYFIIINITLQTIVNDLILNFFTIISSIAYTIGLIYQKTVKTNIQNF